MRRIVLGFSGGVDSAVAAKRLIDGGYDVHGLFLDVGVAGAREDAIRTAQFLGLPLAIRDATEPLARLVCRPFREGYLQGRTINPCLLCNPVMKLAELCRYADETGTESIATGHYAVVRNGALFAGLPANDQSYQLCLITREQLNRLVLPLGDSEKTCVRQEALAAGIPIAKKPDSMDICFIPDHDYAAWVERCGAVPKPGNAVFHGEIIGRHEGIHRYTVGQRWRELYRERRLYVSEINPQTNELTLVLWEELFSANVNVDRVHWLIEPPHESFRARVRVRHTRWEMPMCTVSPSGDGARIVADEPFRAPARGQTAAFYVDDQVVGAGEIV